MSVTVFSWKFRQINVLLKNLTKLIWRKKSVVAYCGNYRNYLCVKMRMFLSPKNISSNQLFSTFFSKNVAFTEFLLKMRESQFPWFPHCVLWKLKKFTLAEKNSSIHLFSDFLSKNVTFTKFFPKKSESKFPSFHTLCVQKYDHWFYGKINIFHIFRQINVFTKKLISRKSLIVNRDCVL